MRSNGNMNDAQGVVSARMEQVESYVTFDVEVDIGQ